MERLPELMNVAELRHRVISQNLANVNTPGYRAMTVSFDEALAASMSSEGGSLRNEAAVRIIPNETTPVQPDGNSVDADHELGELNRNAMLFQMYAQLFQNQVASMRQAIAAPR